jgi:hypothetical protein
MNCLNCGKPTKQLKNGEYMLYCDQYCNSAYHNKLNRQNKQSFYNQLYSIQDIVNKLTQLKIEWNETINYIKEKRMI